MNNKYEYKHNEICEIASEIVNKQLSLKKNIKKPQNLYFIFRHLFLKRQIENFQYTQYSNKSYEV
jgi:hypothetical protein